MITEYRIHTKALYHYWYRFIDGSPNWQHGKRYELSMLNALEVALDRSYDSTRDKLSEDDDWYWRCIAVNRLGFGEMEVIVVRQESMPDPTLVDERFPPESPFKEENRDTQIFKPLPKIK